LLLAYAVYRMLRNLDPIRTAVFAQRASAFFDGMKLFADDLPSYDAAVALLAVHGAIALNDAILIALTSKRSSAEAHDRAVNELQRACKVRSVGNKNGVQHLSWLIANKTAISYADQRFRRADEARVHAERFFSWAYNNFKEVLRAQADA
jgi:hypothetical protein